MKKNYSVAFCLFSVFSFAQQMISFENSDGFYTGNIHGQGIWISTPTGDMPPNVLNQIISTDNASDGIHSLKIVKENIYGTQSIPIIGAFDNLPVLLPYNSFTVSFDISMSQLNGSIFSFQGVSSADEKYIFRLDFDNTGAVKILKILSSIPVMESVLGTWQPNVWYQITVIGTPTGIKYFLNGTLICAGIATEPIDINQLRFIHDNADGTAYIDNIKVYNQALLSAVSDAVNRKRVAVYPNPASDFIKISSSARIKSNGIYDMAGRKPQFNSENDKVDVGNLSAGTYLINVRTENGNFSEKFIKK